MMIRGELRQSYREVPRPVVALGVDYPDGNVIAAHYHNRYQLLYGSTGAVMVATPEGAWMMPPQRGMWIPAGTVHEVQMLGDVRMRSLYLEPGAVAGMPDRCQVVGISALMRGLLADAVTVPATYDVEGRDGALMALILHEIRRCRCRCRCRWTVRWRAAAGRSWPIRRRTTPSTTGATRSASRAARSPGSSGARPG